MPQGIHGNYLVGQKFINTVKERHPDWEIIGDIPEKRNDKTKVKCLKCNQIMEKSRRQLLETTNDCPVCKGSLIIAGYNDAPTKNPWLLNWTSLEEIKGESSSSDKLISITCPNCHCSRQITIKNIVKAINKCPNCSDGMTYSNKFGRSFLKQLPIQILQTEFNPIWSNNYKYDNYFEYKNKKYILEMDGGFHYSEKQFNGSLQDRQERDKIKDELALNHNIILIRIDCQESKLEYIKNNILNSQLNNIFDLSNIDWNKCNEEATNSLVFQVCNYFNQGEYNTLKDIAQHFLISESSVNLYLRKGRELGLCGYFTNTYEKRKDSKVDPSIQYIPKKPKAHKITITIKAYDKDKQYIGTYDSIKKCAEELNKIYNLDFRENKIAEISKGDKQMRRTHRGFYFQRVEPQESEVEACH